MNTETVKDDAVGQSRSTVGLGCPHCGNDEYYRKGRFSGNYKYRYRFDGKDADNTGMHDGADYKEQRTMFCAACHKKVGVVKPNADVTGLAPRKDNE